MNLSLIILAAVFALIAVRKIGGLRLQIWQIMSLGAAASLATGQISPADALRSINLDVMAFLFGMFVVGEALEQSGYLAHLSSALLGKARSAAQLVPLILFSTGIASALLMNDTLAILGTPVVLLLARQHHLSSKPLLLSLAFGVTIGSVMSPIGNPQNLLVAVDGGITNPFVTFLRYLLAPTLINLAIAWLFLALYYRRDLSGSLDSSPPSPIINRELAFLSRLSLSIIVLLVSVKILLVFLDAGVNFRLTYIALAGALPILFYSATPWAVIRRVDWYSLVFFATMFIFTQSVGDSGFFRSEISDLLVSSLSVEMVLLVAVLVSQLLSNVPLVALYLPLLSRAGGGTRAMIALAAGSTIAGNLSILGAASNVIIIQNAERRGQESLSFLEFSRIGAPLTAVNALVYWLFLALL